MRYFALLLLIGITFAVPVCPIYRHSDYIDSNSYNPPHPPTDSLVTSCNLNPNSICLFSDLLNSTEDKELFISEDLANNSFQNISNWNSNLSFGKWFNGSKSSIDIKDAWVSIVYLDPSIYDHGSYIITQNSTINLRYNFTFVVNKNNLGNDCNDDFRVCGYNYLINTTNSTSSINASLSINSEYLVDRSHWVTHCDPTGCWISCDYYRTDTFRDSITVSDSKNISYDNLNPSSNYLISKVYNGLAEVNLSVNDPNLLLSFDNSTFYISNYTYSTRIELAPYDILIKEIIPSNVTEIYGASVLDRNSSYVHLLFPYSQNCTLRIFGYFNQTILSSCNYPNETEYTNITQINPVTPEFIQNIQNLPFLALAVYLPIQFAKKAMLNA